jgi:hypothetical protein
MNADKKTLRHSLATDGQLESVQEQGLQADSALEFATPEELIAFDRSRTPVPEALHPRVSGAVRNSAPESPKPWWKRLF